MYYLIASILLGAVIIFFYYKIYKDKEDKGNLFNNILGAIFFALIVVLFLKSCASTEFKPGDTPSEQSSD